jgi:hypothetical protein
VHARVRRECARLCRSNICVVNQPETILSRDRIYFILKLELILSREGLRCSIGQFEKEYLEASSLNAKLRALRAATKTREEEVTLLILRAGLTTGSGANVDERLVELHGGDVITQRHNEAHGTNAIAVRFPECCSAEHSAGGTVMVFRRSDVIFKTGRPVALECFCCSFGISVPLLG